MDSAVKHLVQLLFDPRRYDLSGGDGEQMLQSLKRLGVLQGDYKVCPGHGALTTLERERQTNPYMRQAMGL